MSDTSLSKEKDFEAFTKQSLEGKVSSLESIAHLVESEVNRLKGNVEYNKGDKCDQSPVPFDLNGAKPNIHQSCDIAYHVLLRVEEKLDELNEVIGVKQKKGTSHGGS